MSWVKLMSVAILCLCSIGLGQIQAGNAQSTPALVSRKGSYVGLFLGDDGVSPTNSGFLSAVVTEQGKLTAKLTLAGRSYRWHGQFTASGTSSNVIARRGQLPLQVQLRLDLAGENGMSGVVGDGAFTASLMAHRAVFSKTTNPAPMGNARYTVVLATEEEPGSGPGGFGFGTLTIDPAGNLRFAGTLGDGTKCSQATFVSEAGDWPLFAPLNSGTGLLLGRVTLTNQPESDLSGQLSWFQSARTSAKTYPAGFGLTNGLQILGGLYTFAKGVRLLNVTNHGVAFLESGNLQQSILNSFTLDTNNRVASPDGLSVRITTGSGLFKGTVFNPVTRHRIAIEGALLLKQNAGFGQFLGARLAGPVFLGATNDLTRPPPPLVTIASTDPNATEGGADSASFTVRRVGGVAGDLTVHYAVGGTAANGEDYAALSGTVMMPAGSSEAVVTVDPIDDQTVNGNRTVVLTLMADSSYTVGAPTAATVTIADDDRPLPTIQKALARLPIANGRVPYYRNRPIDASDPRVTRAIIVVHGAGANFEAYFDRIFEIVPPDWREKVMVIAPHFQDENAAANGEFGWNGDWREGGASGGISSYAVMDAMVGALRNGTFPNLSWIVICGHSAGGQFTQRYAAFTDIDLQPTPNAALVKFVPANPSSYVYLNPYRYDSGSDRWQIPQDTCSGAYNDYKYGLDHLFDYAAMRGADWARSRLPGRWIELLAGTADTQADSDFDSDCPAMQQGSSRYERARNFSAFMGHFYPSNHFSITPVPGIGHDSTLMFASPQGRRALFFPD